MHLIGCTLFELLSRLTMVKGFGRNAHELSMIMDKMASSALQQTLEFFVDCDHLTITMATMTYQINQ